MVEWVKTSGKSIPDAALRAGYENDGKSLFSAKAAVQGVMTPGKCGPFLPGGHFPYAGEEYIINDYEVLVYPPSASGYYEWKKSSGGNVPAGAVWVSDDLYVGRCNYEEGVQPGKVKTSHGVCYFSYGGKEYNNKEYEVLCKVK